ncbi:MAG: hypothetical protein WCJ39_03390 [bacterium]
MDTTKTAGGARLLRHLLANPINDSKQLATRLDHISYYASDEMLRPQMTAIDTHKIHAALHAVSDIPKVMALILYKKLMPALFIRLRATLRIFFENTSLLRELTRL